MTVSSEAVHAYIDGLRSARASIDVFPDPVERQIGLAALREEAVATLRQLSTTAVGVTEATLQPLRTHTADLVGGEMVDKTLAVLDKKAKAAATAALGAVTSWAMTGVVPALVLTAAAIVGGICGFFFNLGALLVTGGLGTFGAFALTRTAQNSGRIGKALSGMWPEASSVGTATERVIAASVAPTARTLWAAAGGRGYAAQRISTKARSYAQSIVAATYVALGVAVLFFAAGAWSAFDSAST